MVRRKVKLAFIVDDAKRKATFKKRRKGILKKVAELTTLCGIEACSIMYSPYVGEADVWPSHSGVHSVIDKFKRMSVMDQNKKMLDNEGFIRQRAVKVNDKLKKQVKDNREKDVAALMYQCLNGRPVQDLRMENLNDLDWLIDQCMDVINKRMAAVKIAPMEEGESSGTILENVGLLEENQDMDLAVDDAIQLPEWINEWINASDEKIGFGHGDEMVMPSNEANNNGSIMPFTAADNNGNMIPFNDVNNNGNMMPFIDADDNGSMMPSRDANNNGSISPGDLLP